MTLSPPNFRDYVLAVIKKGLAKRNYSTPSNAWEKLPTFSPIIKSPVISVRYRTMNVPAGLILYLAQLNMTTTTTFLLD